MRNDCIQNSFCEANQRKILLEVGLKMHKCEKSLVFLYTNNEKTEREIKETIPFTIATNLQLFKKTFLQCAEIHLTSDVFILHQDALPFLVLP